MEDVWLLACTKSQCVRYDLYGEVEQHVGLTFSVEEKIDCTLGLRNCIIFYIDWRDAETHTILQHH